MVATKSGRKLRVTLKKSVNGRLASHQACVRGLGLRRMHHSTVIEDTRCNRGMVDKVAYLLDIEEL
ncbi:MAG: 50S ribosomal protein L30 [Thiotrichales bacterium]|nr:50S ribosomal protein L30 [Thiotrichales bacterium]MCY4285116.1 50S ribosomal protein L30 [Thiotrichales bacterium]MCY4351047.1 50S ribosomal protein L30 [Thiotrichales bacterium]